MHKLTNFKFHLWQFAEENLVTSKDDVAASPRICRAFAVHCELSITIREAQISQVGWQF